jgi:hypothetical protein
MVDDKAIADTKDKRCRILDARYWIPAFAGMTEEIVVYSTVRLYSVQSNS